MKKNNWSCESYNFDEVFGENASQKRVYEAVAKPVVEASHAFHYFFNIQHITNLEKHIFAIILL